MTHEIHPIRSDVDHAAAMRQIKSLWGADPTTIDGRRLDVLITLVDAYEAERWPMGTIADPIGAIKARLEQKGMSEADLVPLLGSREAVTSIMAGQRELTVEMIRRLMDELGISADVLVGAR
jgi:HTH-type transcriptional regulator / antitoxin HigA